MNKLINEIKRNLESHNYLSALALTLILPDICGKIIYPEIKFSSIRYKRWYNEYIYPYELSPLEGNLHNNWVPDGFAIYKLRCNLLHDGSLDINEDVKREKKIEDSTNYRFLLTNSFGSNNLIFEGGNKSKPSDVLVRISVGNFCNKICAVAESIYYDNKPTQEIYNDIVIFDF